MLIGYTRPSYDDIYGEKQQKKLLEIGCAKIISEEHSSPKKRIQLQTLLNTVLPNDKIVVSKLSTFADSTRHLVEQLELLNEKGAFLISLKEELDTSSEDGDRFLSMIKHIVDFQSDLISEKTRIGLSKAKQNGVKTGRPKKPDENVRKAIEMYQSGKYTLAEIKVNTGISKSTLYRYLEQ